MTRKIIPLAVMAACLFGAVISATASPLEEWRNDPLVMLDGKDVDLDEFKWIARPVIVFADSSLDPAFQSQIRFFEDNPERIRERDIVIIVDTDPQGASTLRTQLRPHGFMLVLVGKDGLLKIRKPFPWTMVELGRAIDKMPMRQREIQQRRESK